MSGIFISYRRQDAAGHAARLRYDLTRRYGSERVFLDVADLAPGTDWSVALHQAVANCDVVLVVVGPEWLRATDPMGRRRIDDPDDFIRSEVTAALRLTKPVLPVLVGGASMPAPNQLPSDLTELTRLQALVLDDSGWHAGLQLLFVVLDRLIGAGLPETAKETRSPAASPIPVAVPPLIARINQAWKVLRGRGGGYAMTEGQAAAAAVSASAADARRTMARVGAPRDPQAPQQRHDVFVSYASEDRDFVDELVTALEAQAQRCWIAHRDIPVGVPSWAAPIVTAIASSRLVLVLLTAHSISSTDVLREVSIAADEKIPLLPVKLDGTPLSPGLRYFFVAGQRLDLAGWKSIEQVRRIVSTVGRQLEIKGSM